MSKFKVHLKRLETKAACSCFECLDAFLDPCNNLHNFTQTKNSCSLENFKRQIELKQNNANLLNGQFSNMSSLIVSNFELQSNVFNNEQKNFTH